MPRGDHLAAVLKDVGIDVGGIAEGARITKQQVYRILRGDSRTRESVIELLEATHPEHAYDIRLAWERDMAPQLSIKLDELKRKVRHVDEIAAARTSRAISAGEDGAFEALGLSSPEQLALLDLVTELRRAHPDQPIEPTLKVLAMGIRAAMHPPE